MIESLLVLNPIFASYLLQFGQSIILGCLPVDPSQLIEHVVVRIVDWSVLLLRYLTDVEVIQDLDLG